MHKLFLKLANLSSSYRISKLAAIQFGMNAYMNAEHRERMLQLLVT